MGSLGRPHDHGGTRYRDSSGVDGNDGAEYPEFSADETVIRAEAVRAYHRCRELLAEELGVSPSPETESVYVSIQTKLTVPIRARARARLKTNEPLKHYDHENPHWVVAIPGTVEAPMADGRILR